MFRCEKHGQDMVLVSCPDKKPGCLVAHYGCRRCLVERRAQADERELLEALQQANGLTVAGE